MLKLIDKLLKFDFNNKGAERSSMTYDIDPKRRVTDKPVMLQIKQNPRPF